MSLWYRVSPINDIKKVFSGDGGLFTAGRWNHLGRRAVYCSESIALCTLEWLSHHGLSVSGFTYYRYSIEVPETLLKKFTPQDLPPEWNKIPATEITKDFMENHLFLADKYVAFVLPSVLVPEEFNIIIDPAHQAFHQILPTVKSLGKFVAPKR